MGKSRGRVSQKILWGNTKKRVFLRKGGEFLGPRGRGPRKKKAKQWLQAWGEKLTNTKEGGRVGGRKKGSREKSLRALNNLLGNGDPEF